MRERSSREPAIDVDPPPIHHPEQLTAEEDLVLGIEAELRDGAVGAAEETATSLAERLFGRGELGPEEAFRWALALGLPAGPARNVADHVHELAEYDSGDRVEEEASLELEEPAETVAPDEPHEAPTVGVEQERIYLSYVRADSEWAAWIAQQLEDEGYELALDYVAPEQEPPPEEPTGEPPAGRQLAVTILSTHSFNRVDLGRPAPEIIVRVGGPDITPSDTMIDLARLGPDRGRDDIIGAVYHQGVRPTREPHRRGPRIPFPAEVEAETLDIRARAYSDLPTTEDILGFAPLVAGLDALLNDEQTQLPLAVGVTAPWGAGKSSVMLQLEECLKARTRDGIGPRRWRTVHFEAWKYERSEQLWAALAKAIHDQPQKQMPRWRDRVRFRIALEWKRQGPWRFLAMGLWPLAAAVAVLVLAVLTDLFGTGEDAERTLAIGGVSVTMLVATVGRYWGLVGNPFKRAIDSYIDRAKYADQLGFTSEADEDIRCLTEVLAGEEDKALAVFVDDLDRCSTRHVVDVIEAINQIFNSAAGRRCVFVLGMDREVVSTSIDVAYGDTIDYLDRRRSPLARTFGTHFLAKVVQISVAVPEPDEGGLHRLLAEITGHPVPPEATVSDPEVERFARELQQERPTNPAEVTQARRRVEGQGHARRVRARGACRGRTPRPRAALQRRLGGRRRRRVRRSSAISGAIRGS